MEIIPSGLKTLYNQYADALIDHDMTSSLCTLYYPSRRENCTNCVFTGGFGGGGSSSVYRTGGPAPFNFGNCPMCSGKGFRESEQTEDIRLRTYVSRKDWRTIVPNIQNPDATMMTIGYLTDLPKILKCAHIEIMIHTSGYSKKLFVLDGKPFPHGFYHDRYCVAMWGNK